MIARYYTTTALGPSYYKSYNLSLWALMQLVAVLLPFSTLEDQQSLAHKPGACLRYFKSLFVKYTTARLGAMMPLESNAWPCNNGELPTNPSTRYLVFAE